jgi:hypothetical protein
MDLLVQQALADGEVSHVRVEPRGQYVGYGDGGPDMSYQQQDDILVLADSSVAAARAQTALTVKSSHQDGVS